MFNNAKKFMKYIGGFFFVVFVNCAYSHDENPPDKISSGNYETDLCGLTVDKSNIKKEIQTLEKQWGKFKKTKNDDEGDIFEGNKKSLKIKIYSWPDGKINTIEASGIDAEGICKTGRGLQLGNKRYDVKKLYKNYTPEEKSQISLHWNDTANTIYIIEDKKGKISSITLIGEIE